MTPLTRSASSLALGTPSPARSTCMPGPWSSHLRDTGMGPHVVSSSDTGKELQLQQ